MTEITTAEAGARTQQRYEPQYLHDGTWWSTGEPCSTMAAAIARAKTADPNHCNGNVIRVIEVVTVIKSTQVWELTGVNKPVSDRKLVS